MNPQQMRQIQQQADEALKSASDSQYDDAIQILRGALYEIRDTLAYHLERQDHNLAFQRCIDLAKPTTLAEAVAKGKADYKRITEDVN